MVDDDDADVILVMVSVFGTATDIGYRPFSLP